MERVQNPIFGLLQFVAVVVALYIIWSWNEGQLGNWGWPVALGIASVPALIVWLLKKKHKPN